MTSHIESVSKYLSLNLNKVRKHLPPANQTTSTKLLKILLILYTNPKLTATGIKKILHSPSPTTEISINYLFESGYIKKLSKPYYISQLGAWKVNTIYQLSDKGISLLKQIDKEISEIDHHVTT